MRVLVCGGRDFTNYNKLEKELDIYFIQSCREVDVLIHGGARGADTLADQYAEVNGIAQERYIADWKKYGKAAGVIRNQEMLDTKPDLVIAFPGGRGTAHMVKIAKEASVKVIEIESP